MAIVDCGKGHLYDNSRYSSCPYCGGNNRVVDYTSRDSGKTATPGGYGGDSGSGKTVAPGGYGGDSGGGKTVAPGGYGGNGGKTVDPNRHKDSGGKTVSPDWMRHSLPYVVGWLVCVKGKNRGTDFRLLEKINTVGRDPSNDVCVPGDLAISKERHVRIAYDAKKNQFHILPGDATVSSAYVNDEPVYVPVKLQPYDLIELGNSTFLFVPLCGERFTWDKKDQENGK